MPTLGFTGTQKGMTPQQIQAVQDLILKLKPAVARHGDCVGADAQFHEAVQEHLPDALILIHPPQITNKRAFCRGAVALPAKAYLERNHDIVDAVSHMLATPAEFEEIQRSGTWATIRYARKQNKPLMIVFPDGVCYED